MTQEEKARAYDEAMERARKQKYDYQKELNKTDKNSQLAGLLRSGISALEMAFPDLAESEDERIRKWLLDYAIEMIAALEHDISISIYDGEKGRDPEAEAELNQWQKARAYLEKQKEQKPVEWKPSEEQMETLLNIEGDLRAFQSYDKAKIIADLYEQLKRLL